LCVNKLWCASHLQTKRHSWMLSNSRGEWIKSRSRTNNLVSILVSYSFLFQLILGEILEIESQSWIKVISASLFFFFLFFLCFFWSNICCSYLAIIHKQKRSADRPISLSFLIVWNDGALISCSKRKGREGGCSSHSRTFCHANLSRYRSLTQVGIYPPDGKYQQCGTCSMEKGREEVFFSTVKRVIWLCFNCVRLGQVLFSESIDVGESAIFSLADFHVIHMRYKDL
jgi:hypothetical protein